MEDFPDQDPILHYDPRDDQLSLLDDVVQTAEPTPSDMFWDQLHGTLLTNLKNLDILN